MNATEAARYAEANPEAAAQGEKLIRGIITRASSDADFRTQLTSDARAAVSAYTGRDVPASFELRFVEAGTAVAESDRERTVVLPAGEGAELTEDELEAVAGGDVILLVLTCVAAGAALGMALHAADCSMH